MISQTANTTNGGPSVKKRPHYSAKIRFVMFHWQILKMIGRKCRTVLKKRARHVVTENARVIAAVSALESGDLPEFGRSDRRVAREPSRRFRSKLPGIGRDGRYRAATAGYSRSKDDGRRFWRLYDQPDACPKPGNEFIPNVVRRISQ